MWAEGGARRGLGWMARRLHRACRARVELGMGRRVSGCRAGADMLGGERRGEGGEGGGERREGERREGDRRPQGRPGQGNRGGARSGGLGGSVGPLPPGTEPEPGARLFAV